MFAAGLLDLELVRLRYLLGRLGHLTKEGLRSQRYGVRLKV